MLLEGLDKMIHMIEANSPGNFGYLRCAASAISFKVIGFE